ncbi:transglycosylase SLT domain-containing protein [Treponema sp. OMZ 840]|uniref:lytic transglycosylase domain-containing protein n=1 Tax=Treponema sp. OMZ 840 TaxID=244313 RepID=UPI003D94D3AF
MKRVFAGAAFYMFCCVLIFIRFPLAAEEDTMQSPAAHTKPTVQTGSAVHSETVIQTETAVQSETVVQTETMVQSKTAVQAAQKIKPAYVPLDIPYSEHKLIDKYRKEFMSDFGRKWLASVMQNAAVYRPYIRKKLAEYGLPQCLEFLPVIESSYNIYAVSKSGATGLWQFMENSITGLLEKNEWLDERKDPWFSTRAAAKKLKNNYDYFSNWELALAAYNMGLGGISRIVQKAGKKDFWYLADKGLLRTETKNYVPKFIAIADLITNAAYYGLEIPPYNADAALSFSECILPRQINLEVLAEDTGIEYEIYKFLNPSLRYPITPPVESYRLRIPENCENLVLNALSNQQTSPFTHTYTVKQGDTLWALSRRFGISVETLCAINNRNPDAILGIGTVLFVPILK